MRTEPEKKRLLLERILKKCRKIITARIFDHYNSLARTSAAFNVVQVASTNPYPPPSLLTIPSPTTVATDRWLAAAAVDRGQNFIASHPHPPHPVPATSRRLSNAIIVFRAQQTSLVLTASAARGHEISSDAEGSRTPDDPRDRCSTENDTPARNLHTKFAISPAPKSPSSTPVDQVGS